MKVFISGPYTHGDVAANVRAAIDAGMWVADHGGAPYVPHLSHFMHLVHPREYEFWMELDLRWLKECDCLVKLDGFSPGSGREAKDMKSLGRPVFASVEQWYVWFTLEKQRMRVTTGD